MFNDTTRDDRFSDAHFICHGACNPVAITGTLHKHMLAMSRNGADHPTIKADFAIRLMAYQLAYLLRVDVMEADHGEYCTVAEAVEANERARIRANVGLS